MVVVLAVAGIIAALMQTLVVPLIGDLPRILDTSASNASWVITATLLDRGGRDARSAAASATCSASAGSC